LLGLAAVALLTQFADHARPEAGQSTRPSSRREQSKAAFEVLKGRSRLSGEKTRPASLDVEDWGAWSATTLCRKRKLLQIIGCLSIASRIHRLIGPNEQWGNPPSQCTPEGSAETSAH
jgi:hypothetical protein